MLLLAPLAGCEKESSPRVLSSWRSVHQYYREESVDPKHPFSNEMSTDVTDAESYKLTFYENGTGCGSCPRFDETGRFDFRFTWDVKEGQLRTIADKGIVIKTYEGGYRYTGVGWDMEECTHDRMVLSINTWNFVERGMGDPRPSETTSTYRYTFEKVK